MPEYLLRSPQPKRSGRRSAYISSLLLIVCMLIGMTAPAEARIQDTGEEEHTVFIVAVGVDTYANTRLAGAVNDAEKISEALKVVSAREGARVDLQVLTEERATEEGIEEALAHVARSARRDDRFVFFFAGMGQAGAFGLYGSDVSGIEAGSSAHDVFDGRRLQAWTDRIEAKDQLFLLDACHTTDAFAAIVAPFRSSALTEALTGRNMMVMGPSDLTLEIQVGGGKAHGTFTYALLAGLKGYADINQDNSITARELNSFVQNEPLRSESIRQFAATDSLEVPDLTIDARSSGSDFSIGAARPFRNPFYRVELASPTLYTSADSFVVVLSTPGVRTDPRESESSPRRARPGQDSGRGPSPSAAPASTISLSGTPGLGFAAPAPPVSQILVNGNNVMRGEAVVLRDSSLQADVTSRDDPADLLMDHGGSLRVVHPLLPGENTIEMEIIDGAGNSTVYRYPIMRGAQTRGAKGPPAEDESEPEQGNNYALLFGTDTYASGEWDDLSNPVLDVETIAGDLRERYGFETEIVRNPTKRQVLEKIYAYMKERTFGENDQLLIFFAGHGYFDEDLGIGYLVPSDAEDGDVLRDSYLSYLKLNKMVDNMSAGHVLLVLDACHSGTFDPALRGEGETVRPERMDVDAFVRQQLQYTTRQYITAGRNVTVSDGIPGRHSPFARGILEALRSGGGGDGLLTLGELYGYLERIEPGPHRGEFGRNEPGSTFFFRAR